MGLIDRLVAIWRQENPDEPLVDPRASAMSRRRFLGIVGSTATAAAVAPLVDLERLVWTPGQSIVVPDLGEVAAFGGGGNQLLTVDWITKESLRILSENMKMSSMVNRVYDEQFAMRGQTLEVVMNPTVDLRVDLKHGRRRDFDRDIKPQILAHAQLTDTPLPIDAHVNKVVLATEGETKAYGVLKGSTLTVKRVS